MARNVVPPQRPALTPEEKRHIIDRLQRRISDLEAFDPKSVQQRFGSPDVKALEASIEGTLSAAFGHGTPDYNRYFSAAELDHGPRTMRSGFERGPRREDMPEVFQRYLREGRDRAVALLKQAIQGLEEELEVATAGAGKPTAVLRQSPSDRVFVVHGHDEAALQGFARFLEKLGLKATVLREQPNQGRTIIEKFEDCASDVGFAVVLLTPDDVGAAALATEPQARARQNVVFELGYFAGKLGRGKVCLLRKGQVEVPSDLYGVIYTDMDVAEGWKMALVREMKAAKLDFDANRMWG